MMNALAFQPDRHTVGADAATICAHCGLTVPSGLLSDAQAEQFCCHGCQTAYGVIHSCGLDNFYRLLDRGTDDHAPAKSTGRGYAECDSAGFQAQYCSGLPGGLMQTELLLEGVHCSACVWLVEKLPRVVPGVIEARLDFRRATVHVTWDTTRVPLSRVARALDALGYAPHPARGRSAREARRTEDRRMLVRMAVAGACAGNIMLLFLALYAGMFEGIEHGYEQLFRWVSMALNTICLAWPALIFATSALAALRTRSIHLDVPIALGLYLGGAWGIYKTIAGQGDLYFDSISALVFFLLVGRYVQQRQQRFAADAIELLFAVTPAVARRVTTDAQGHESILEVATDALALGDLVEVRAGDCVPADGLVITGHSQVDLSMLTGESRPVHISSGQKVAAGAVNLSGLLRLRVEATGQQTRIGKMMHLVEEAAQHRAAIVRLADRLGAWLLWALLALSALTLAIWWHLGPAIAIDRAAALLIATCPCGLGLATPLVMTVALGRAARRRVLIKGGDTLQALADAGTRGTIVLDKTGTLTLGKLSMVRWIGDEALKPLVAALEAVSSHPVAKALVRDLVEPRSDVDHHITTGTIVQHQGLGIEGLVNSRPMLAGSRAWLHTRGISIDSTLDRAADRAIADGYSPVLISIDGVAVAMAAMGDPLRGDAQASIAALRHRGWRVRVLSGDDPALVTAVGQSLGLSSEDLLGGAWPEDKLAAIQSMLKDGPVVMVGDGVNDAAALAAATVGIAVRGGAEASLSAADVSLGCEGLSPIVDLLDGAGGAMRTIHFTIASSLAYNVIAGSLAIAGLISPLLAAIIMPASSLTVVAIAMNSGAFSSKRLRHRRLIEPSIEQQPSPPSPAAHSHNSVQEGIA